MIAIPLMILVHGSPVDAALLVFAAALAGAALIVDLALAALLLVTTFLRRE